MNHSNMEVENMRSERYKLPNQINLNPASKRQKDYAASLGIFLPHGATISDASALIARELDDDVQASKELLGYADANDIVCSPYVGSKYLHTLIFDNLEGAKKAAFFCFCIYNFYFKDINDVGNTLENKDIQESIEDFGKEYVNNFYFMTSMEEYYGEELVAFGKSTKSLEDGTKRTVYGGSIHTTAFKKAYEYLKTCLNA